VSFGAIVLLAAGLAMDCMAVAAARGLATPRIEARHVVSVSVLFGGAQALMPVLGWALGHQLGPLVAAWDHWIAFALLVAIGGKMLWEARGPAEGADAPPAGGDLYAVSVLLVLALATSIDAFAVGITLPMLSAPFVLSIATIGVVTALLSALGLLAGHRFGALLGPRLEIAGGLVLVGLGVKILVEHLGA
jgi:putative Mn2+ efflux pump MntP